MPDIGAMMQSMGGGGQGGMPDIGAMMKSMGGGGAGGMDLGAMMKSLGPMMGQMAPPQAAENQNLMNSLRNVTEAPEQAPDQPMPVPRVVPSPDQKCEGSVLALKDSIHKLSGVSFPAFKHSADRDNSEVCASNLLDLNQNTQIMLSYMQRCAELLRRGERMTDAERDELFKLQKLVNDSMEQLSRAFYHVALQFKAINVPAATAQSVKVQAAQPQQPTVVKMVEKKERASLKPAQVEEIKDDRPLFTKVGE